MKEFTLTGREKLRRIDPVILFCVLGMNLMSLLTLASASDSFTAGLWYMKVQGLVSLVGMVVMSVLIYIDYDAMVKSLRYVFFGLSVGLLVFVKFFGTGSLGNSNWISIPGTNISIQPSEFVKISFIITFSLHLAAVKDKINKPLVLLGVFAHAGLIVGLVLWTKDLGTSLVYMAIVAFMLFAAGLSVWYFVGVGAAGVIASPLIWKLLSENQQQRILFGFNPDLDPLDKGWNAIHSRNCIISGGFFGNGFSGGTKYFDLFAGQSDFCFAVLAEKFGMLGCIVYMTLLTVLIFRILRVARNTKRKYASFLCVGVAAMLIAQGAENIGMCLAFLPVVGITLPFLSYGSSSLLSLYIAVGLVESVAAHNEMTHIDRISD